MMLPDYWLTRPSVNFDEGTQTAFDELLNTTLSLGGCPTIQFTLPWKKMAVSLPCRRSAQHRLARFRRS